MELGPDAKWLPRSALEAALFPVMQAAGAVALEHRGRAKWSRKGDGSPVSDADRAAEAVLVAGIRGAAPGEAIRAEESGGEASAPGEPLWVIDPIDGTGAFIEGLAHWGPTLARLLPGPHETQIQAGATWFPRLREWYFIEAGVGAFRDRVRLPPLGDGPVGYHSILCIPSRLHRVTRLIWPGKVRCLGSIAAHLALTAAGAARAALVPPGWSAWDTAAGLGLIEAVGGRTCALDGAPLDVLRHEGQAFVAGDATAVDWLLSSGTFTSLTP